jgi:imidazolonepropionase-like amidohydrolase
MKYKFILFFICLLGITFSSTAQKQTIFYNVHYIDISKGLVTKNAVVSIDVNGKLKLLKKKPIANANTVVKDGTGAYLMPSLYDMHVHWPDVMPDTYFDACLATGITHIRMMNSSAEAMQYIQSRKVNRPVFQVGFPIRENFTFTNAEQSMDSIKKAGYDFVKFFNVKNRKDFTALAMAANKYKLPICGHALPNVPMDTLFSYGYRSVEHVGYLDNLKDKALDSAILKFKMYNVAVCPTLDWMLVAYGAIPEDSLKLRAGTAYAKKYYYTHWDTAYKKPSVTFGENAPKYADFAKKSIAKKIMILKKLKDAGVQILIGSDAEEPYQTPGYSLIEEMKLIAPAGFSNMELLQMATSGAETYWNSMGQNVKKEKSFVLYRENPLENLNNLESLLLNFSPNMYFQK